MLIAIGSVKGSPGVTTLAVALAARWPVQGPGRPVVVECDPSGGSLAARFGLRTAPGLVSLTAAARQDTEPGLLWAHTQPLPGGLPAVVAPPGADYTRAALATLLDARRAVSVLRGAARPGAVVIADCGRLDPGSPAAAIAREADRLLLVARPRPDELSHLMAAMSMVDLWAMHPHLVLTGSGYPPAAVARELGVPVLAVIPHDEPGAAALTGLPGRRRGPDRSRLGRAAYALARAVLDTHPASGHAAVTERPAAPVASGHNPWPSPRLLPGNGARTEDRR